MTIESAWANLGAIFTLRPRGEVSIIMAAAGELMLAVHVGACEAYDCELTDENRHLYENEHRHQACGDDYWCEQAKAIKELAL